MNGEEQAQAQKAAVEWDAAGATGLAGMGYGKGQVDKTAAEHLKMAAEHIAEAQRILARVK